jgi:hypothetical protein
MKNGVEMPISAVLSEVNKPNAVFSITYRKTDGSFGEKKRCINRRANLNDRKKMNRSGLLSLTDLDKRQDFEVYIDFLRSFNSTEIDHER